MKTNSCNPKLGHGVTQVMSSHYPECLGLVICINHNPVFQGVYKAIKVFLDPNTAAKVVLVGNKKKRLELFNKRFPPELTDWLTQEIKLNKQEPIPESQTQFWLPPEVAEAHDPRGCPSYIREHILPLQEPMPGAASVARQKPHPNILAYFHQDTASA